jgi:hypothetical protein
VAPALPTFARSFDVSVTAASIVISAFAFMRLGFAPFSGKLVSAFGERPVFIWGITVVGLSTGACALAADYWQLLVLRSLGGVGSTMPKPRAITKLTATSTQTSRGSRGASLAAEGNADSCAAPTSHHLVDLLSDAHSTTETQPVAHPAAFPPEVGLTQRILPITPRSSSRS